MAEYDPTIQALLSQVDDDWGDPKINRDNLVPYGIKYIDQALYGVDILNGELIVFMGAEKQRKTTIVVNILMNIMLGDKPKDKPYMVVDTLESGMHPKRYRDTLISNMATRYLLGYGHRYDAPCPVCDTEKCKELGLSPEYLRYNLRSKEQQIAINYAIETMMEWPVLVFGANGYQGNTRNLKYSVQGEGSRWRSVIDEYGAKIFIVDHVQQFSFADEPTDYEKQLRATAAIGDMVAQEHIAVFMLSQVSLTSLRESRKGDGRLNAAGGSKIQQEANVVFSVSYIQNSGMIKLTIEESRKSGTFSVWQPIEDVSGAFSGTASNTPVQLEGYNDK